MPRRRPRTNTGVPGLSFSMRRALGVTRARQRLSWLTGIPTSRTGRQRKIGAATGCMMPLVALAAVAGAVTALMLA